MGMWQSIVMRKDNETVIITGYTRSPANQEQLYRLKVAATDEHGKKWTVKHPQTMYVRADIKREMLDCRIALEQDGFEFYELSGESQL